MKNNNRSNVLLGLALATALLTTGCGGGGDGGGTTSPSPVVASTAPDSAEQEQKASAMALAHVRAADSLQAQPEAAALKASGATLSTDMLQYTVYLNNALLDASKVTVTADTVSISAPLAEGKNEVLLFAPDAVGAPAEAKVTFWAGSSNVAGRVVDDTGKPVAGATVSAALGDDSTVTATTTSDASGNY